MSLLRKQDEEQDGIEVAWEDQQRINAFSKYNARLSDIQDELKKKKEEKEYFDDLEMELELWDEDQTVPYKQGDAFFHLSLSHATRQLSLDKRKLDKDLQSLEKSVRECEDGMKGLKVELYAKFGNQINLEPNPAED